MKIIREDNEYKLVRPFNTWDTNYHLIDKETRTDYLIDICDLSEYEHLTLESNFDELKEIAWTKNEDKYKHLKGTNRIF